MSFLILDRGCQRLSPADRSARVAGLHARGFRP